MIKRLREWKRGRKRKEKDNFQRNKEIISLPHHIILKKVAARHNHFFVLNDKRCQELTHTSGFWKGSVLYMSNSEIFSAQRQI